jgi:hypothetical protein
VTVTKWSKTAPGCLWLETLFMNLEAKYLIVLEYMAMITENQTGAVWDKFVTKSYIFIKIEA